MFVAEPRNMCHLSAVQGGGSVDGAPAGARLAFHGLAAHGARRYLHNKVECTDVTHWRNLR